MPTASHRVDDAQTELPDLMARRLGEILELPSLKTVSAGPRVMAARYGLARRRGVDNRKHHSPTASDRVAEGSTEIVALDSEGQTEAVGAETFASSGGIVSTMLTFAPSMT